MCDSEASKSASVAGVLTAGRRRGVGAVPGLRREARVAERDALRYVQGVVLVELVGPIGGVVVDVARVRGEPSAPARASTAAADGRRPAAKVVTPVSAQCGGHVRVLDPRSARR